MSTAIARFNPFEARSLPVTVTPGMTLLDIARAAQAPGWFYDIGVIRVDGRVYQRPMWAHVRPKPGRFVDLCAAPGKGKVGKILLVLATVALVIGTAFVGAGALAGLGFGAAFGAGTTGAALAAAGLGIAGQLALNALTPAPSPSGAGSNANRELSQAGISGNALTLGESVAGVIGQIRVSPQILMPSYATLENDRLWIHAMVGLAGRCQIADVLINGIAAADVPRLEMETFEGDGGGAVAALASRTVIQDAQPMILSNFELRNELATNDQFVDQAAPENSLSRWHHFKTKGAADEAWIRLLFEGGIVKTSGVRHSLPLRIELRKSGDAAWRALPVFHIKDSKAAGPFRREIKLIFGVPRAGRWLARNDDLDIHAAYRITGSGQAFEYSADAYFTQTAEPTIATPDMTGPTTSGVTVTASTEFSAGTLAWKAFDRDEATTWQTTSPGPPHWIKVDHGSGVQKTIRSYALKKWTAELNANSNPLTWQLYGSNNDTDYDLIHDHSVSDDGLDSNWMQVSLIAPYRYHRFDILSVRVPGTLNLVIGEIQLSEQNNLGSSFDGTKGTGCAPLSRIARYVKLTYDGAEVYLDPADWDKGEYEVRVKRGWAYLTTSLDLDVTNTGQCDRYFYGTAADATFFDDKVVSGFHVAGLGQKDIQSKTIVDAFATVENIRPVRADIEARLATICIRVPDLTVESVSAVFTGYARGFGGVVWNDVAAASRNPAGYYRDALLLRDRNAMPLPGEIIDEYSLEAWQAFATTEGFTCDAVVHNRSVSEVLALLASSGRASPRQANRWGVVIDRDRSAEPASQMISPLNGRDLGTQVTYAKIPHGLRAQFLDAADDYAVKDILVYRAGFTAANATLIEAITYAGITSEARAVAQASYDLKQMLRRKIEYVREVGLEGLSFGRGDIVNLSDEVIGRWHFYGLVKSVTTAAGNVTGFTLDAVAEIAAAQGELTAETDIDSETDILAPSLAMGAFIRLTDGSCITRQLVETADSAAFTFATPLADSGTIIAGALVAIGPLGREAHRTIVRKIEPSGHDLFRISLVPEAPEIHA